VGADEIAAAYRDASLAVLSSVWPEPFGMAGPEAMRHGLPVVAFDAGGIKEWLHDSVNGCLVPWMDRSAFAKCVDQLLMDKPLARQLGEQGRHLVRQYDATRQVARLEELFHQVAAVAKETLCA
jgi:glycosyltransferase involved in cell wall biosynthesis